MMGNDCILYGIIAMLFFLLFGHDTRVYYGIIAILFFLLFGEPILVFILFLLILL